MNGTPLTALTGRLFDGHALHPRATLLIQGNKVLEVTTQDITSEAQVIHLNPDETLLPGLADLHVHTRPWYAAWFLEAGITTVRDAGGPLNALKEQHQWAAQGIGPRVFGAAVMLDSENSFFRNFGPEAFTPIGNFNAASWAINTPEQAIQAVNVLADNGADTIKLYEQLSPDVYAAAVQQAKERGLDVMTDLGMGMTRALNGATVDALQALKLGVRTIEHASGFMLAFQRMGFNLPTDFPSEAVLEQFAQAVVEANTILIPTLSVMEALRHDKRAPLTRLPAGQHDNETMTSLKQQWDAAHAHTSKNRALVEWDARFAAALAERILKLGGQVGAGTDTPAGADNLPGGGLHAELEYLVKNANFSPIQALQAATGSANKIVGGGRGILAPNSVADAVIVRVDPTRDITATRNIQQVMFNGQFLDNLNSTFMAHVRLPRA